MIDVLQVYLRSLRLFRTVQAVLAGTGALQRPLFQDDMAAVNVDLPIATKNSLRVKVLATMDRVTSQADDLLSLGGTSDLTVQAAVQQQPNEAPKRVAELEELAVKLIQASVPVELDGTLVIQMDTGGEADLLAKTATAATVIKMWAVWARPQIETL